MEEDVLIDWAPPPRPAPLGPELLERPFPWLKLGLGLAVVLLISWLIWFLWKKIGRRKELAASQLELALEAIGVAENSDGAVMASELSLIVRTYLFSVTDDEAIYETSEELSQRAVVLKGLSVKSREETVTFLKEVDGLRYKPQVEASDVRPMATRARFILEKIDKELEVDDLSS